MSFNRKKKIKRIIIAMICVNKNYVYDVRFSYSFFDFSFGILPTFIYVVFVQHFNGVVEKIRHEVLRRIIIKLLLSTQITIFAQNNTPQQY